MEGLEPAGEPTPVTSTLYGDKTGASAAKQEWMVALRQRFCKPEMLIAGGALNPKYFEPKTDPLRTRSWGPEQLDALKAAFRTYGIGNWAEMRQAVLSSWTDTELRIQASYVLGRQDLSIYAGWQPTAEEIQAEYEKNKAQGAATGLWRGGVLLNEAYGYLLKDSEPSLGKPTTTDAAAGAPGSGSGPVVL